MRLTERLMNEQTCQVMERDGVPRGFGFVTFATDEEAVACLQRGPHVMKGKQIDAKRADLNRPRMS